MLKIVIIIALTCVFTFGQQKAINFNHPFSHTLVLSISGGASIGNTDFNDSKPGFSGGGIVEYFLPAFDYGIFGLRAQLTGSNVHIAEAGTDTAFKSDVYLLGGGISFLYPAGESIFPYVYGGISYLEFYPNLLNGNPAPNRRAKVYTPVSFSYHLEVGSRFALSSNLSLFMNMNYTFLQTDYLDDNNLNNNNDKFMTFNAGISFSFFGVKNSDDDNLPDDEDECPELSEDYDGFMDDDGCPEYDNDGDGIPDTEDKCPNTAEDKDGFNDSDGCPDIDNDNDNIFDQDDACPNLPEDFDGFEDEDGCPDLDNDKDGILDSKDLCINSAEDLDGYMDEDGCPDPDNDHDLIPDEEDRCPNKPETVNGFEDDDGCPDEVPDYRQQRKTDESSRLSPLRQPDLNRSTNVKPYVPSRVVLDAVVTFEDDKPDLKSNAYKELDELADWMIKNPSAKWRIEGHSDRSDKIDGFGNLSGRRAREIMLYLVKKGVPYSQLEVVDLQDKYPRATNQRPSSRALNRRVEIIKIK